MPSNTKERSRAQVCSYIKRTSVPSNTGHKYELMLLVLGIEGLSTNLQFVIYFERRASNLDVSLIIYNNPSATSFDPRPTGQPVENGLRSRFHHHSLTFIKNALLGRVEHPKYTRLIRTLFTIQEI